MQNYGILGTCPSGQLEGLHIKPYGVNANSVNNWGMPVGIAEGTPDVIRTVTSRNEIPQGISCPSVCRGIEKNVIAIRNVFLSRNRQAVAVQTNDITVTLGDPVFIGTDGMLTTTATTGWKMGSVASPIEELYLDINFNVVKGFLLELCSVVWIGGA